MIICTFAGHREPLTPMDSLLIPNRLRASLNDHLMLDDKFRFCFGGMGWFDRQCAHTAQSAKRLHPEKEMQLTLILPYPRKIEDENLYDEIFIPDEIKHLHYSAAIPARNRWLVDHSQYLIAYVSRNSGGAATTLQHARICGLTIWNLAD